MDIKIPNDPTTRPQAQNKPKVSIGMPVYNGKPFIREALDSLVAQTFTDFELIISDNASTDGTSAICREYAAKDRRISYERHTENRGGNFNFKYVLDLALGEYFMWAACDDLRSEDFIEKLLVGFENSDVMSSFCVSREIDEDGSIINERVDFDFSGKSSVARVWKYSLDYRALRDMPIYGIHKRERLLNYKSKIKPWGWINKSNPSNAGHPVMIYLLAAGQHYICKSETLFSRRVVLHQEWKNEVVSRKKWAKKLAFFVLKFQLFFRSMNAVFSGSDSVFVTFTVAPILLYASIRPILTKLLFPIYRKLLK